MIDLLNLNSTEDIYELMAGAEDSARGGSQDDVARKELNILLAYFQEVDKWIQKNQDPESLRAGVAYYIKMYSLSKALGNRVGEHRWNARAKRLARQLLSATADVEDLKLLCRVMHQRLDYLWYEKRETHGKLTCNQLLDYVRGYDLDCNPWDEEDVLLELAKAYEVNAKWYGSFGGERAWYEICCIRATRLRLFLAEQEKRIMLQRQCDVYMDAAKQYLDAEQKPDPKQARNHLNRALALMRRFPKLFGNRDRVPVAYERLADSWKMEAEAELSEARKLKLRLQAKECRVRALDGWKALYLWLFNRDLENREVRIGMRRCYEALAEDCAALPGEKNAAKAEKYRLLAQDVDVS